MEPVADQLCNCALLSSSPPNQKPIISRHPKILFKLQPGFCTKCLEVLNTPYPHMRRLRPQRKIKPRIAFTGMLAAIAERPIQTKDSILRQRPRHTAKHSLHLFPGHDMRRIGGERAVDGG